LWDGDAGATGCGCSRRLEDFLLHLYRLGSRTLNPDDPLLRCLILSGMLMIFSVSFVMSIYGGVPIPPAPSRQLVPWNETCLLLLAVQIEQYVNTVETSTFLCLIGIVSWLARMFSLMFQLNCGRGGSASTVNTRDLKTMSFVLGEKL
jgi:hypothetical protein